MKDFVSEVDKRRRTQLASLEATVSNNFIKSLTPAFSLKLKTSCSFLKNLARIDQLLGWSHNFLGFLIFNKKKEKSNLI
jgi:hypothetical protein